MQYLIEEVDFTNEKRTSRVIDAENTPRAKEIALKNQTFNGMLRIYDKDLFLICYKESSKAE